MESVIADLQGVQMQLYLHVACSCLWTYDYSLTFASEIALIWDAPWNVPKNLFLLTRYLPIFNLGIVILNHFIPNISLAACLASDKFLTWMINICMLTAEIVLTMRTWAVWQRSRKAGLYLFGLLFTVFTTGFIVTGFWASDLENISVPETMVPSGCYPAPKNSLNYVNYVLILIFEGVLFVLMSIKGYQALFDPSDADVFKGGLKSIVYIDGILYYIFIFGLSIINITINLSLPKQYANMLSLLQQIMHSLLACRMLLRLRGYGKRTIRGPGFTNFDSQMTMADSKIAFNPLVNLASSDIDSDSHEYSIGDRPSSFSVA